MHILVMVVIALETLSCNTLMQYLKWGLVVLYTSTRMIMSQGCQKRFFDTTRNIQYKLGS